MTQKNAVYYSFNFLKNIFRFAIDFSQVILYNCDTTEHKEGDAMYFVTKRTEIIEDEFTVQYGIADETQIFFFFTKDKKEAQSVADLLNGCKVEPVHVIDIIEDMFYT